MLKDTADYRVESTGTILFRLMPGPGRQHHPFHDRAVAVAMAVKGVTDPPGSEIRVVHVPTGEVIFRVPATPVATGQES